MLNVNNQGEESLEFQMLLHSYFRVDVSPSLSHTQVIRGCGWWQLANDMLTL